MENIYGAVGLFILGIGLLNHSGNGNVAQIIIMILAVLLTIGFFLVIKHLLGKILHPILATILALTLAVPAMLFFFQYLLTIAAIVCVVSFALYYIFECN